MNNQHFKFSTHLQSLENNTKIGVLNGITSSKRSSNVEANLYTLINSVKNHQDFMNVVNYFNEYQEKGTFFSDKLISTYFSFITKRENVVDNISEIVENSFSLIEKPHLYQYSIIMQFFAKKWDYLKVTFYFEKILAEGIKPDRRIYTSMILAHTKLPDTTLAEYYYRELVSNFSTKEVHHSIFVMMIKMFSSKNDIKKMELYVEEMKSQNIMPKFYIFELLKNVSENLFDVERIEKYKNQLQIRKAEDAGSLMQKNETDWKLLNEKLLSMLSSSLAADRYEEIIRYFNSCILRIEFPTETVDEYLNFLTKNSKYPNSAKNLQRAFASMRVPSVNQITTMMKFFAKRRESDTVLFYFNKITKKFVAYTALIHAHCTAGNTTQAVKYFYEMQEKGYVPDAAIYSIMVQHFSEVFDDVNMVNFYNQMKSNGCNIKPYIYFCMMRCFYEKLNFEKMECYFKELVKAEFTPSQSCFAWIIDCAAKNKKIDKMEFYYNLMKTSGFDPKFFIYETVLRAYNESQNYEKIEEILMEMEKRDLKFFFDSAYKKNASNVDRSKSHVKVQISQNLPNNLVYKSASFLPIILNQEEILANFRIVNKNLDEYVLLYEKYISDASQRNMAISQYLKFLLKEDRSNDILKAFYTISLPNANHFKLILSFFAFNHQYTSAQSILNEMKAAGFQPTINHYTILLKAYTFHPESEKIDSLFCNLLLENVEPDLTYFNTLMSVFAERNEVKSVELYYDQLISIGLKPDVETYTQLFKCFACVKDHSRSEFFYNKMLKENLKPTLFIFNYIIEAFSELNLSSAEHFMKQMMANNIMPTFTTYNLLLNACVSDGNVPKLEFYINEMKSKKMTPSLATLNNMIQCYLNDDDIPKATSYLTINNFTPNLDTYSCLISAYGRKKDYKNILLYERKLVRSPEFKKPCTKILNALLFRKWRNVDELWENLKTFELLNIEFNSVTWANVLFSLNSLKQYQFSLDIYQCLTNTYQGQVPPKIPFRLSPIILEKDSSDLFSTALESCRLGGYTNEFRVIWNYALDSKIRLNPRVLTSYLKCLCQFDKFENAVQVLKSLALIKESSLTVREERVIPNKNTFFEIMALLQKKNRMVLVFILKRCMNGIGLEFSEEAYEGIEVEDIIPVLARSGEAHNNFLENNVSFNSLPLNSETQNTTSSDQHAVGEDLDSIEKKVWVCGKCSKTFKLKKDGGLSVHILKHNC
ncbi:hypothetical protein HK099_006029 [Clydaea vesicula]|uniref:Pentatricopeptide repeat-containing protein n=1 Tax=Clydaea vesicula TaxID=447962 RepID=A0AAD5XZN5_9FUNG|nr:hypothetical protein HK099_006029 [Clydaea vesicula]